MKREITISLLETFPNLREKVSSHSHISWSLKIYLIASGVRIEPEEDNAGRRVEVDYKDIINKFRASLKNNARIWYSMYIDGRIPDFCTQRQDGKQSRVGFFLTSIQ